MADPYLIDLDTWSDDITRDIVIQRWLKQIASLVGGGGALPTIPAYSVLSNNTGATAQPSGNQSLILGAPGFADSNIFFQATGNANSYIQAIIQNKDTAASSSADYIVANDQATASTFYGDFGINSSVFSGTGSLALPNATYLYSANGDLVLGTLTSGVSAGNTIHFVIANGATDAAQVTSTALSLPSTTTSGLQLFNTADQTTNYEKYGLFWSSNRLIVGYQNGGTGATTRGVRLQSGSAKNVLTVDSVGSLPSLYFQGIQNAATGNLITFDNSTGNAGATSGSQVFLALVPTYNQVASTATNTDFLISRIETSLGSGAQYFISCAGGSAGTTTKFTVNNSGTITAGGVTNNGTSASNLTVAPTNTASSGTNNNYGFLLYSTVNQTSTAAYTDLLVNRASNTPGSGNQFLQDWQVASTSKAHIDTNGNMSVSGAFGSASIAVNAGSATTPSINFNNTTGLYSTAPGIGFAVAGVNAATLTSGTFAISAPAATDAAITLNEAGGTVVMKIPGGTNNFTIGLTGLTATPLVTMAPGAGYQSMTVSPQNANSSVAVNNYGLAVASTINQTSTANFTDLLVNRTNTAAGSGTQRLLDLQVGSSSKFNINTSGVIGSYNGQATAGNGVVTVASSNRVTAQTGAASLAAYTVGATDGDFLVGANVLVTASTTHSFTCTCTYTDEGSTSRTLTLNFSQLSGAFITAITNVTGASAYSGVPVQIRAKAATTITLATTGTFTSVTYNFSGSIRQT